jgi:hypothetical protein
MAVFWVSRHPRYLGWISEVIKIAEIKSIYAVMKGNSAFLGMARFLQFWRSQDAHAPLDLPHAP